VGFLTRATFEALDPVFTARPSNPDATVTDEVRRPPPGVAPRRTDREALSNRTDRSPKILHAAKIAVRGRAPEPLVIL